MYAYLQTGQDAAARRLLQSLPDIVDRSRGKTVASAAPPSAGSYAASAIPARWALERGAWADAAKLEMRTSDLPYADALTAYARAVGAARSGDVAAARVGVAQLEALVKRQAALNETYWAGQIDIQRQTAAAWLAFAEGQPSKALAQMRAAADAEDRTEKAAVTPGPLAPAREQLGEMLLATNDAAGALKEFQATLLKEPNRFRTVYGAAKSAAASGDAAAAHRYYGDLLKICSRGDVPGRPELQEARAAMSKAQAERRSNTMRLVFVPFRLLATPQQLAVLVNCCALMSTSTGSSPAATAAGITISSRRSAPPRTSPTSNAT
jgi:hypothetical protein